MATNGTRIPAWRRLGLALQSEAQSGVAVTEPTTSHGGEIQHATAPEAIKETQIVSEPSTDPAQNGKSSKLGKRKHQHEAAEESAPTPSKKSRTVAEESNSYADVALDAPATAQEDHAMPDPTPEEPSATTPAKGGDPNYRQGKKKKPKLTPRDRKKLAQQNEAAAAPSPAEAVPLRTKATLLASTEVDHLPAPLFSTPTKHQPILRDRSKDSSGSPPRTDRRKSVAFTPDTKKKDGDSGQTWFKKWAAEQKGEDSENIEQPSFTSAPATIEGPKEIAKVEKKEKKKDTKEKASSRETEAAAFAASAAAKEEQDAAQPTLEQPKPSKDTKTQPAPTTKGKKKDPSIYISYLNQYYNDRDNWKFNKAKQNDVVDNALNIFRIPDEHSDALLEYIKGLKGAGVIERLRQKTLATIKELDTEDAKAPAMDEEAQNTAKEAALQERVTKERKRRKVEGDVEGLANHPNGDAYIRRMRRSRAEALLSALGRTAPILPAPKPTTNINPTMQDLAPRERARKKKRRTDISSDESSSDSSSDESSSDESDSDDDASSDSDSGSASGGDSSSEGDSSDGSGSDNSSDSDSGSDSD